MRVAIVGAGIAGLAAARELKLNGIDPILFEAEDRVGGRVCTEKIGPYVFDTGASSIAPRNRALERVMLESLPKDDLVEVALPIFIHQSLRISPGESAKNRIERFTYRAGNQRLPELLASGLDVRLRARVDSIAESQTGLIIDGQDFDAAVLTPPTPLCREILTSSHDPRPMANASYRSCLSVMLGYDVEFKAPNYHALLDPEQRHPLTWLSIESAKCPGRAPVGHTAMVAQLGPAFSEMSFDAPETVIVSAAVEFVERLYGKEWSNPVATGLRRWRYSQPERTASFDRVNFDRNRLVVAGDGVMGARVEYAFDSGQMAAGRIVELAAGKDN